MSIRTINEFRRLAAGMILGLSILLTNVAQAAITPVYVSTAGNNANTGALGLPVATISNALTKLTDGGIIYVDPGIYTEPQIPIINMNCSIIATGGPSVTVLQPAASVAAATTPVMKMAGGYNNTNLIKISGLTFRYGNPNNAGASLALAAGLNIGAGYTLGIDVTLTNCVICSNRFYSTVAPVDGEGAAISMLGSAGTAGAVGYNKFAMYDCSVLWNIAAGDTAAHAPYSCGVSLVCSNVTIRGCTFAYNTFSNVSPVLTLSTGPYPCAPLGVYCTTVTVQNCTIASNGWWTGTDGYPLGNVGGMFLRCYSNAANIAGNPIGRAGALIQGCTIVGNAASNYTGGLYLQDVRYASVGGFAPITIENCIIASNKVRTSATLTTVCSPDLYMATYTANEAIGYTPVERYNIIGNGASNANGGTLYSWCPVATNSSGVVIANAHNSWVGSNGVPVTVTTAPLQNNGGKTMTVAQKAGSKAIDNGTNTAFSPALTLANDQRGAPYERTYGLNTDIGAFEYKAGPTNLMYNAYGWSDFPYGAGQISYLTTNGLTPMILTLDNAAFAGTDLTPWSAGEISSRMGITNLPNGLTVNVMPTNSLAAAVIWLTGTASDPHAAANSLSNLVFGFTDAAFTNPLNNASAAQISGVLTTNLNITYHNAVSAGTLSFSTNFVENIVYNDGRIETTNTINLSGDVWANGISSGSLTSYITFTGVPAGLTAQVDASGTAQAKFYFTGQATSHSAANSTSNVVMTFAASAFDRNNAAAGSVSTNVITFLDPASLVTLNYNGTTFSENGANDGTMGGTLTITLVSNLFVSGAASFVSSPDLPASLALQVTYVDQSTISIALTGSAANNNVFDNKSFNVQFQPGAFYNLGPGVAVVNSNQAVNLSFLNPTLTWGGSFTEKMPDNDGEIDPATFVTGTLVGDTFAAPGSSFTTNNLPAGLGMIVTLTSPTTVKVTLTNHAAAHAAVNSTNNLGLTFLDSAFTKSSTHGGASAVTGYNPANWTVTFFDPSKYWYVSQTGSDANTGTSSASPFATLSNAVKQAGSYDIIHVLPGAVNEGEVNGVVVNKPLQFEGEDTLTTKGISILQGAPALAAATNRIFYMNYYNNVPYVSLRNLTLRNGVDGPATAGGGAISHTYPGPNALLVISNCYFYNFQATNSGGGVIIEANGNYQTHIFSSTFCSNKCLGQGAVLANTYNAGELCVYDSAFFANAADLTLNPALSTAYDAGCVPGFWVGTTLTNVLFQNSTFYNNSAVTVTNVNNPAGVIVLNCPVWTIRNCTIVSNNLPGLMCSGVELNKDNIVASSYMNLQSTIIAMNQAWTNGGAKDFKSTVTLTYPINESCNLIGDATNSAFVAGVPLFTLGQTNVNGSYIGNSGVADYPVVSPLIAPIANNGGPTPTCALQPGSLAINAGSNPGNLLYDQRGPDYKRVVGVRADIGAYEFGAGTPGGLVIIIQ